MWYSNTGVWCVCAAALREAAGGAGQAAGAGGAGGAGRALPAAGGARASDAARAAAHQRRDRPRHGEDRVAGARLKGPGCRSRRAHNESTSRNHAAARVRPRRDAGPAVREHAYAHTFLACLLFVKDFLFIL